MADDETPDPPDETSAAPDETFDPFEAFDPASVRLRPIGWVLDPATGVPRPEPDILVWADWMETHSADRQIAKTVSGCVRVSTIFLGVDYGWHGPTILFETIVFGGIFDHDCRRYQTRAEALVGHLTYAALVQAYRTAPRQVRKSVRKLQTDQPLTRGDLQRIWRFRAWRRRLLPWEARGD